MVFDEHFIKKINRREAEAFKILFRNFYTPLVVHAIHYVEEQTVAEDIVQGLITDLWEDPGTYRSFPAFRSFLYQSVKNRCINHLRHQQVERKYISYTLQHAETFEGDEQREIEEEVYRILFQAIDELPERCKEVFELHLAGKKNEEIAGLLQISILTVKSQKQKALHILKEKMGQAFILALFLKII